MATIAQDSFTDTDGTALTAHTGETGATWTAVGGSAVLSINSNRAIPTIGFSVGGFIAASGVPGAAEYDVTIDVIRRSDVASLQVGAFGRYDTGTLECYLLAYRQGDLGWRLYRLGSGGSFTSLGLYSQTLTADQVYQAKLEILDATKKVFVDGVERLSSTNNTVTAAGRVGVYGAKGFTSASATTGLHIDNFLAETPGGGAVDATGTVTAGSATATGGTHTASAGGTGTVTAGTASATGGAQSATAGTSGSVTAGTASASGGSQQASAGASGAIVAGQATAAGGTHTASAGTQASGTVGAGSANAGGGSHSATAGAAGTVAVGTANAEGGTHAGTAGTQASGTVTAGSASAEGGTHTAAAGANASVAVGNADASGYTVLASVSVDGQITAGGATAGGGTHQASAGAVGTVDAGSAAAEGGTHTATTIIPVEGVLTGHLVIKPVLTARPRILPALQSRIVILPVVRASVKVKDMDTGLAGATIRILLKDLEMLDATSVYEAVASGADVTVTLVAPDGTETDAGSVVESDGDYYVDLARPATAGQYRAKVEAEVDGSAVGRWTADFRVRGWT